ncbi:MAG TPA: DUF6612 family protein [Chloroflexota bacterium]|nr:DUF6612 family protein [Chloroflexota bacterium]
MSELRSCVLAILLIAAVGIQAAGAPAAFAQSQRTATSVATPAAVPTTKPSTSGAATATPRGTSVPATATPTAVTAATPTAISAPTTAALPDARALLDASNAAMNGVTSMRMRGAMDFQMDATDMSFSMNMPITAEFVAPDRMHMTISSGALGFSGEILMVGSQLWTRSGDGSWETMSSSDLSAPVNPTMMARPGNTDLSRFLINPTVSDEGASYRVSTDVDMAQAIAEGSSAASMMGTDMTGMDMFDLSSMTVHLNLSVNKATQYVDSMEMTMTMVMPDTEMSAGSAGSMTIHLNFTVTDFNNPAIRVEPPTL